MARRASSFGFLGMFGRSEYLRSIDAALRPVGLHKAVVPEGVKLALSRLMQDEIGDPSPQAYAEACALLAYCMLGPDGFAGANGEDAVAPMERRIEAALTAGRGLDAGILLLAHHAGLIQPSVVARHGITVDET